MQSLSYLFALVLRFEIYLEISLFLSRCKVEDPSES